MTTIFTHAITRDPGKAISNAISSKGLVPNFPSAKKQHNKYKLMLKSLGLAVYELKELPDFPDSLFVEDPALLFNDNCVILRPGIDSRFGESKALESDICTIFSNIFWVKSGKIEGGDILRIGSHFIIGLSKRTNKDGATNLSKILKSLGATVEISRTPKGILHFKSDCSLITNDTILATERLIKTGFFSNKYRLIKVPEGEELGANCLSINDYVLIPKGFHGISELLTKEYKIKEVDVSEMEKVDAGLSCMSLRW